MVIVAIALCLTKHWMYQVRAPPLERCYIVLPFQAKQSE